MGSRDCLLTDTKSRQGERTRYFSRQLITADDLTQDQIYHREKRRLHNRLLHGWGIVCGLEVKVNPISGASLNVTICPGYALSPQGDEIYVPADVQFDLGQCIAGQDAPCHSPCAPVISGAVDPAKDFYVAIKYAECLSHPVRVSPVGCGCDDTACEYSRIRDGFEVTCLDSLPDSHGEAFQISDALCSIVNATKVVTCPMCPKSPWVVLAQVHVKGAAIETLSVDPRHVLLTTAMMQAHLSAKCVEEQ
jgi:hypothetical protein